jgi:hypothetical protein
MIQLPPGGDVGHLQHPHVVCHQRGGGCRGKLEIPGGPDGNWWITHCNHKLQTSQPPNHPSKKGPGKKRVFLRKVQRRICYHYL